MMEEIIFERLAGNNLQLPIFATAGSACFDLSACLTRKLFLIKNSSKMPFVFDISKEHQRNYDVDNIECINPDIDPTLIIDVNETILIPTGFKTSFNDWRVLKLFMRSSMAINGLILANSVGIIDSDYRGEVFMAVKNISNFSRQLRHGDRIVQALYEEVYRPKLIEGNVQDTIRGAGGFGSTGR